MNYNNYLQKCLTEQENTLNQGNVNDFYKKRIIPDGWYVHGRGNKQELNKEYVTQLSKDWDVAEQYAGKEGSIWLIKPSSKSIVFDATKNINLKKIKDKIIELYENGNLNVEIVRLIEQFGDDEEIINNTINNLIEEINPIDIVNSAGVWDNTDFVEWWINTFNYDFIITNNGAIVIDIENVYKVKVNNIYENYNNYLQKCLIEQEENSLNDKDIYSKEFKSWFGDWENDWKRCSKITDSNNKPLIVYHGSNYNFNEFKLNNEIDESHMSHLIGIFFTKDVDIAKSYGSIIYKCYLNIRKPFKISVDNLIKIDTKDKAIKMRNSLIKQGYDGIIQLGYSIEDNMSQIIAFYPNQIKSIYNNGKWNKNSPNIYESYKNYINKRIK